MFEKSTSDAQPPEEPPKRMPAKRLRQTMYWLALDWIHLREMEPVVSVQRFQDIARSSNVKDYGHPQEWASDSARDIVDKLSGWHDYLAEHRDERRPPFGVAFGSTGFRSRIETQQVEQLRLVAAWKYLEPRCEQLVQLVDLEALKELPDLHNKIRSALGQYVPKYTIPVPCPNDECGLRTLMRVMGIGQDFITCDSCGYTIKDSYYPLLVKMTLDAFMPANPASTICTGTVNATDTGVSESPERNPQLGAHRHWGFFAC